ncbi:MAG: SemiSWEET transporter [Methylococcaceae bacterium]|jgi:MtN3 and saliva related transmembrane protein
MESYDLVGIIAGTLTTLSFVPQVFKTWRSRSARDISTGMFLLFSLGVALWLIYGLAIQSMPIIVSNVLTLILSCSIIAMKIAFK